MTSYEIARRAITFEKPERLPFNFCYFSDFGWVSINKFDLLTSPYNIYSNPTEEQKRDGWGCYWESIGSNMGQVKKSPIDDWSKLKGYKFPDTTREELYCGIPEDLAKIKDKFVWASLGFGIWERSQQLRGFENLLMDLADEDKRVFDLIEGIVNVMLNLVKNYSKFKNIHGIAMCDDWGTQLSTLISPHSFRKFYKPVYQKLISSIHDAGLYFHLHTCGKVNDFMEDFIECGVDVINLQQPRTLGIEEIGKLYRGRITFESPVDIQSTWPSNNKQRIRDEAKMLIECLWTDKGGFIAGDYSAPQSIGVSEESRQEAFKAFCEFGKAESLLKYLPL